MVENKDSRNKPADEGTKGDPGLRDDSVIQPGANTVSDGKGDGANENLTKTSGDSFREKEWAKDADEAFDDIGSK